MNIEELKKEYAEQDNRLTAFPIYVSVQELHCVGVMADGYSAVCPYGDGETRVEYKINADGEPDCFDTYAEAEQMLSVVKLHPEVVAMVCPECKGLGEIPVSYLDRGAPAMCENCHGSGVVGRKNG
jgi:hypothetical protein